MSTPRTLALALLPALLLACKGELVCASNQTECGGRCFALATDRNNCGACGVTCADGDTCSAGACRACTATCTGTRGCQGNLCLPDLFVGCPATNQLLPRSASLAATGPGRDVTAGLTVLTSADGVLYTGSGYPAAAVDLVPQDPALAPSHVPLAGSDLEGIAVHREVVFVSNASTSSLVLLSTRGALLDEVPLPGQERGPNPHGIAFAAGKAYVALYGRGPGSGQAIATIDLSGLAACTAETAPPACGAGGACDAGRHCVAGLCRLPCATATGAIDLTALPGSFDAPGMPFPSGALGVGDKTYVTLSNLKDLDGDGYYTEPAGSGKLAVVDGANGDAVSIVDLGAECGNPGGLALRGSTLWVACGSFSFSAAWPGRLVPVELGSSPVVGSAVATGAVVPNGIRFCGSAGYIPDMLTGAVLPFDPAARTTGVGVDVCPLSGPPFPFAYAADVLCAP